MKIEAFLKKNSKSRELHLNFSLDVSLLTHSDRATLSSGSGGRWRIGSGEGNQCQEPAEFTLDLHNLLVSTSRCTAEACVSALESRVWSTKTTCSREFGTKSEVNCMYCNTFKVNNNSARD